MPTYRSAGEQVVTNAIGPHAKKEAGKVNAEEADFGVDQLDATGQLRPFQPIDFGRPLSIVLRKVYTGRFPEQHLFSSKKPMLVTSAIRDAMTTAAATRALNILREEVQPGSRFNGPDAASQGTPLLYYSPALASPFLTISLAVMFENLDKELFTRASALFGNLAGVPIFMPAMGYLLGASTVLKLAGDVGSQILNGTPALSDNLQLDFSFGGGALPQPGYWVFSAGSTDMTKYKFDPKRGLISQNNSAEYDGPDPVIVVSVDGGAVDSAANFTPLMVSANILGRFFNQRDGSEVAMDTILEAAKLVNDLGYRKKAEETKDKLAALPKDSPEAKKLQDSLKTFNQNIGESRLRLSTA
jgi:hypothetical protein